MGQKCGKRGAGCGCDSGGRVTNGRNFWKTQWIGAERGAGRMKSDEATNQRIAKMSFATVYPLYLAKVQKKGRTQEELDQVIRWLTGLSDERLAELVAERADFESVFAEASLNPAAGKITGVICGVRVEEITNPLTQKVRYLDKLVDELAKGRALEKVLR